MTHISDLIARLEAATKPDDEIDRDLLRLFYPGDASVAERRIAEAEADVDPNLFMARHDAFLRQAWEFGNFKKFTHYIDAALALAAHALPGYGYFIRRDDDGCNAAMLYPEAMRVTPGTATASTQPVAICLAVLKAKQAQAADDFQKAQSNG